MSSHKRAISTSANDAEPPKSKQRSEKSTTTPQPAPAFPHYVYVVIVENKPAYGDQGSYVEGVYCSIEDANNCVKKVARTEYTNAEDAEKGIKPDGIVYWSSFDVGEGDAAEIRVEKHKLRAPGSERARDWPSGSDSDEGSAGEQDEDDDDV